MQISASLGTGDNDYAPLRFLLLLSLVRIRVCHVLPAFDYCSGAEQKGHCWDHPAELLFGMDDDWVGGRTGVGGEDGHPHGGAVSVGTRRLASCATCISGLIFPFLFAAGMVACTRPNAVPKADPASSLESITAADPARYPSFQEGKHWSNPYLVIGADHVGLLSDVAANEEQLLKPGEVLNALAQLPASAWPYGRAVAILVDEKSANSEQSKVAVRRNRGIVEGDLDRAHVAIRWIPDS